MLLLYTEHATRYNLAEYPAMYDLASRNVHISKCPCRVGSIAIVQDRACDLSYLGWRLTPIYDPDPLSEGVDGIEDDAALLEEPGTAKHAI